MGIYSRVHLHHEGECTCSFGGPHADVWRSGSTQEYSSHSLVLMHRVVLAWIGDLVGNAEREGGKEGERECVREREGRNITISLRLRVIVTDGQRESTPTNDHSRQMKAAKEMASECRGNPKIRFILFSNSDV